MTQWVFTHVPATGFLAFRADLSAGAWAAVDTSEYEGPERYAAKPIGDAPLVVAIKLRLKLAIDAVDEAIEGAGNAKQKDQQWDAHEKHLSALIAAAEASPEPSKREAATRLRKMLLLGGGQGQTRLRYQQEVDFARQQLSHASKGQGAVDVALLGLQSVMTGIAMATDELAAAIGHGTSGQSPSQRKATATAACSATFAWAAQLLAVLSEVGHPGADRERALTMREPLADLIARYPPPVHAAKPTIVEPAVVQ